MRGEIMSYWGVYLDDNTPFPDLQVYHDQLLSWVENDKKRKEQEFEFWTKLVNEAVKAITGVR